MAYSSFRGSFVVGVLLSLAFTWSLPANAAIIQVFTNEAAWAAAAGTPISTEDFSDTTLVTGLTVTPAGGGSISGGMLSNSVAIFQLCANGGVGCPPAPVTTQFGFSPATTAFGADWDLSPGGAGNGISFDILLNNGTHQTVAGISNPGGVAFNGFFGFVSDTPFTSITLTTQSLTGNSETFNADNVRFVGSGVVAAVPEPSSLALLAGGLFTVWMIRRRKMA